MITTKSGKGGKKGLGVSFTSSAVWDKPYQFIKEQMEYGQGERVFEWQYDNTDTWGPKLDGKFNADYWDVSAQQWKNGPMISSNEDRVKAYLQTGNTISKSLQIPSLLLTSNSPPWLLVMISYAIDKPRPVP